MAILSSVVNFFTGKEKEKTVRFIAPNTSIDGFEIDCTLSTDHEMVNTISQNPVQFGVKITDNVIVEPDTVFLEAIISEYDPQLAGLVSTGGIISDAIDLFSGDSNDLSRAQTIYNNLVRLRNLEDGVTFSMAVYPTILDNLVVQSLRFSDSGKNGYGLRFTMGVRKIQIAETSIFTGSSKEPTKGAYTPTTDGGFKLSKSVDTGDI